jgi:hypothetical protein
VQLKEETFMAIKLKTLTYCIAICIIALMSSCSANVNVGADDNVIDNAGVIDNEQKAIETAQIYVLDKYNQSFNEYRVTAKLEEDIWVVSYGLQTPVPGGGGPALRIEKRSGEIISCQLQK